MTDRAALLADLRREGDELEQLVTGLDEAAFATPTPAQGWTIAHQIAHLAWTDRRSILAATDADGFNAEIEQAMRDPQGYVDSGAAEGVGKPPEVLVANWRDERLALLDVLAQVQEGVKLPWFGPPMGAASMATARLMETWAHGQDVADALGVRREPTPRLRHVAHLGVRTRDFAYVLHGRTPPATLFRVELVGPDREEWTWGPPESDQRVTGPALDFCLLVTQRRHLADLAVTAQGAEAEQWLGIAQTFAGPPGNGRRPGQFDASAVESQSG